MPVEQTDRPIVRVSHKAQDIRLFLDSGSRYNLIDYNTFKKYFTQRIETYRGPQMCDVNKHRIEIVGESYVTLRIKDTRFTLRVIIAKNITFEGEILLGSNSWKQLGLRYLSDEDRVIIRGHSLDLMKKGYRTLEMSRNTATSVDIGSGHTESKKQSRSTLKDILNLTQKVKIRNQHMIELAPGERKIITGKTKANHNGKNGIVVQGSEEINGLEVTPSLNTFLNNTTNIEVVNLSGSQIKLAKGNVVCTAEIYQREIKIEGNWRDNKKIPPSSVAGVIELSEERDKKRKEMLSGENGIKYEAGREGLINLLKKYNEVIALPGDKLGHTNLLEHHIEIDKDIRPIYIPAYKLAYSQLECIEDEVRNMLQDGIIEESKSPWSFPLIVVPKADGSYRVVVDFRRLNKETQTDPYPVPNMRDLISKIGQKKVFSTLDLLSGFLQVPLDESSREKTAFTTQSGHYQFRRMPFGLKSSPITFVRLMDRVLHGMLGKNVFCYIDDLIVATNTVEEHLTVMQKVLERLNQAGLKVKLSKCNFLQKQLKYLGHTISQEGIRVNEDKVEAIKEYPVPKNVKQVKSFLGLSGFYRRFIPQYGMIATPLTNLTRENQPFIWGSEQQEAFDTLKHKLVTAPVLIMPDFDQEFIIATDASTLGIGAVLMQKREKKLQPIAYYSRKLRTSTELNYSVTDKESLAIVEALKHFRFIIFGQKITVLTDHAPCQELFKNPNLSGKKARWYLLVNDFQVTIKYIPGKCNLVADALSRIVCHLENPIETSELDLNTPCIFEQQRKDAVLSPMIKELEDVELGIRAIQDGVGKIELDKSGILKRTFMYENKDMLPRLIEQIMIPESLKGLAMKAIHEGPGRAHPGRDETLRQTKMYYHWNTLPQDVQNYVQDCIVCQQNRSNQIKPAPLNTYPTPSQPFERVNIDLLALNETDSGYRYLLVCIDALTRYSELIPLRTKTAKEVSEALYDGIIARYSAPEIIVSDNGLEFNNKLLKFLCETYEIKKVNIQPHTPKANGLVERCNRKILEGLRKLLATEQVTKQTNWEPKIPSIQSALNTQIHSSTGESPHRALYGFKPRLPTTSLLEKPRVDYGENPIENRIEMAKVMHQEVRNRIDVSNKKMKEKYDKNSEKKLVEIGDQVFVKQTSHPQANYKLRSRNKGPYKVIGISQNKIRIEYLGEPHHIKTVHLDTVSLYKKVENSSHIATISNPNQPQKRVDMLVKNPSTGGRHKVALIDLSEILVNGNQIRTDAVRNMKLACAKGFKVVLLLTNTEKQKWEKSQLDNFLEALHEITKVPFQFFLFHSQGRILPNLENLWHLIQGKYNNQLEYKKEDSRVIGSNPTSIKLAKQLGLTNVVNSRNKVK